jgi:hypothetical protein
MNFGAILQFPIIDEWSKKFIGTTVTQRLLARRTGDLLRGLGHPVSVHSDTDAELDRNTIVVSAEYDVERDELGKRRYIGITLVTNPKSTKKLKFDSDMANCLSLDIIEALCHEYRHEHQYRTRDFDVYGDFKSTHKDIEQRRQQEYLGIPDEIDAFSTNIAIRLWLIYGDDAYKKLQECETLDYEASPDLWGYLQSFGLHHNVTRRLVRKIVKNINQLCEWKSECIKTGIVGVNQFTLKSISSGSAAYNLKQAISE